MQVVICSDAQALSHQAALLVADAITANPRLVLGLAAGATPIGMYHELVRLHAQGLDFSQVTAFGLDEYFALPLNHPASFHTCIGRHLLSGVNIAPSRVHWPDSSSAGDVADHCAAFEAKIAAAGGIDLQILGIGVNGHLGFNEPGSSLDGRTGLVRLSAETLKANAKDFPPPEKMPEAAVTQGLATILSARRLLLMASGESKADAIAAAIEGPVTTALPASALQRHPDVTVSLDEAAAARLTGASPGKRPGTEPTRQPG